MTSRLRPKRVTPFAALVVLLGSHLSACVAEIELPASVAREFAERLSAGGEVAPAGLGARDSLRLEAGLCLYGHEIDTSTSPVAAGLG